MKKIKYPSEISNQKLNYFFKIYKLDKIILESKRQNLSVNNFYSKEIYKPELKQLYRIFQYVVLNKRITVLEFGCGWSSIIFTLALNKNKKLFESKVRKLRRNNPFELYTIDNMKKYLLITKKNLNSLIINNSIKNHFLYSKVNITKYNGKISTEYNFIPTVSPDFIYLDGPEQYAIGGSINGFNMNHKDIVPMTCDILRLEYFLIPGTILIVDGRGANARFLKNNFQRNWKYKYIKKHDEHVFILNEHPYGRIGLMQKKFFEE